MLGGNQEYSNLNEALPYWFNGLVPLAYQTNNTRLIRQVINTAENFWARTPLLLGLTQLVEVNAGTSLAEQILAHRFVPLMHGMLSNNLQGLVAHSRDYFDGQWGRSRAADMILQLQWLHENQDYIENDLDTIPREIADKLYHFEHGTTFGKGLTRRFSHHGNPSGGIVANERLVGLSPSQITRAALSIIRRDNGIAHSLLGPGKVTSSTKAGVNVEIDCSTNYPFDGILTYTIEADDAFTFSVRHVAIYHGALLYVLPVSSNVTSKIADYPNAPAGARDYTLAPTSTWGLTIDPSTLRFEVSNNFFGLPGLLYIPDRVPVSISATGCKIRWELTEGGYAPEPPKPEERECISDPYEVGLVPYGTAKLHLAELPTVDLSEWRT
ncbi:hypothetical protein AJ80_00658 [Polytolypa hystricis UAMH7299]|uniref:Uncharacterized protein n=1 Tax=Polytolypa hystricis (strain UAMH7299) TaxID=1447883 RepID=A0A2B7Z209_POLH7|nr:hypothetical protein AJ80_00658 [Polytolypa hystricis UAMH7299]